MLDKVLKSTTLATLLLGAAAFAADPAAAASHKTHRRHVAHAGGSQQLVSDGPGTAFGFHRDPAPFRVGAWRRHRGPTAIQETADIDAATSGGAWGFPGDSVYGEGKYSSYGVYSGADGYGSPYFAGFYGPASGTDYGPFGQAYDDE